MGAKITQRSAKAKYDYATVERAVSVAFLVDAAGQRGWLRGRLQNFRRLGMAPEGPGKGKMISYAVEDVDRWLIGLEMAHLRIDPTLIVATINQNWKALRELAAEARASRKPEDDVLVTVRFGPLAAAPDIGHTTLKGINSFGYWLGDESRRASIFNLSARLRALDRALAAPPPPLPALPGGMAGQILRAGRRARKVRE